MNPLRRSGSPSLWLICLDSFLPAWMHCNKTKNPDGGSRDEKRRKKKPGFNKREEKTPKIFSFVL